MRLQPPFIPLSTRRLSGVCQARFTPLNKYVTFWLRFEPGVAAIQQPVPTRVSETVLSKGAKAVSEGGFVRYTMRHICCMRTTELYIDAKYK